MKHITPSKNNHIYIINSEKFKTFSVSFYFMTALTEENINRNALFPFLLKQGSMKYPNMKALNIELQKFYGGSFNASARKKGDIHLVEFRFEFLREKFCEKGYTKDVLAFMKEVLLNPYVTDGGFCEEYVNREKTNLIDYINGVVNDKREYTTVRLTEEMFEGENYALFEYGKPEIIEKQNGKTLYGQYKKVITTAPLIAFIHGDIDETEFLDCFNDLFKNEREDIPKTSIYNKNLKEVKVTQETQNIVQGKFALGFSTDTNPDDEDYYALTLLNGVFGSGPTSKLFMNVREKMSLCYYVFSRLNRLKGTMLVSIGTDRENFKKAYDEILKQLNDCKNGNISDEEITFAKKFIISVLKQSGDSQHSISEFYLTGILCEKMITPEEYIEKIQNLTKDDLVNAAEKIKLQTEYYLK